MKRMNLLAILALAVLPVFSGTADEILTKNASAMGGNESVSDLKSIITTGSMVVNGMSIKMSTYLKEGNKMLSEQSIESMNIKITMACDGTDCYSNDPMTGMRLIEGQERAQFVQQNDITSVFDWEKMYVKREYKGEESVSGKATHVIYLETPDGMKTTNYYDQENFMLLKSTVTAKGPMGEMAVDLFFDEYKDVHNGFKIPVKMHTKAMNLDGVLEITDVEINTEIPDSKFALPEGLK